MLNICTASVERGNVHDFIITNDLHKSYDFTNETTYTSALGVAVAYEKDIAEILNKKFEEISFKNIERVLHIASECSIDIDVEYLRYNFIVYPEGRITLGGDMAKIKNNLEEIKEEYEKWRQNNIKRYTSVVIINGK